MLTQEQADAVRAAIAAGATRKAAAKVMAADYDDVRRAVDRGAPRSSSRRNAELRPLIIQAALRNDRPEDVAATLGVSVSTVRKIWGDAPELAEWRARPPVRRAGETAGAFAVRVTNWKIMHDPARAAQRAALQRKARAASHKRKTRTAEAKARKAINGHAAVTIPPAPVPVPAVINPPRPSWWRRLLRWS